MEKKRVTLRDVAKKANVSVATVSIVINGNNQMRIREKTRQRILDVARELNYQPDLNAQILKGKTSSMIGLLIPDITNPFYPEVVRGVTDKANSLGYNVILFNSDNKLEQEAFFIDTLKSLKVAGVIICGVDDGGEQEAALLATLDRDGIPVVAVDRGVLNGKIPSVMIENREACFEAVEYLIKGGHKRIAFVETGQSVGIMEDRFRGYKEALEAYGLEVSKDLFYHLKSTNLEYLHQANGLVKKIRRAKPKITAIFATADVVAIEIIRAAKQLNIRVPEDLSVIGFDDIQLAELIDPPLTTVWQPKYEMGQISMIVLNSMIKEELVAQKTVILAPKFIPRKSAQSLKEV